MKNICFIANYYKTDVYLAIAKKIESDNIKVHWIVPNRKQYDRLSQIFELEVLLYIGKNDILNSDFDELDLDLGIHELVYGDRVLREESPSWTYDYILKLKNAYHHFFKSHKINFVFGEVTWAHEILAFRMTTYALGLKSKFLNPHTIRIPNGRFGFFVDEFQSQLAKRESAEDYSDVRIVPEKPAYLALNDKLIESKYTLKHHLVLMKNFISRKNQDANDPTLYGNPITQFKIRTTEIKNRLAFNRLVAEHNFESLPKEPKRVLVTLHKQPEASIDVLGRYYEDQLKLIVNIWRIIPENHILLVKEHSNAIGDRNVSFYKKIKQLRNTYLVDSQINSYTILENCAAVFTISGTIAYEAALMNIPSFTFTPTFFNRLRFCREISWKDFRSRSSFEQFLERTDKEREGLSVEDFSKWLMNHSFEGIMSDSFGDPRSISVENINKLAKAFLEVIK